MANISFNISKGCVAAYMRTVGTGNAALIVVPIETTGIVSDATMRDYATLADILAGTSNEQTTMGRKAITSVTVTVDNTNDRVDIDCADITWDAATGNAISALVFCYDPDTTSGDDSSIIPLAKYDLVATPSGAPLVAQIYSTGFYRDN